MTSTSLGRDPFTDTTAQAGLDDWIRERRQDFLDFDRSIGFSHVDDGLTDLFSPIPPKFAIAGDQRTVSPPLNSRYPVSEPQRSVDKMSQDGQELSPKAKVSYDQDKFEVEFNVKDYTPEELSIKTEGDILIVLAKHETKTENGGSYVSKQFEQRFSLPSGVKPEKISSSLSKDGYLTVSAPRENLAISGFKKTRGALEETDFNSGQVFSQSKETKDAEGLPHPKVKYDDDKFQISLDAQDYKPEELDVKVEGNTIIITAKQEVAESGGTRTRIFEQKFSLPSGVKGEKVTSTLNKEGVLIITAPRGNPAASYSTQTIENKMDKVMSPASWEVEDKKRDNITSRHGTDITSRHGSLFDKNNSLFTQSLVDDRGIFDRAERSGSLFDRDDRALFAGNSEQGGVSRVQYDDDTYKILVNVVDYKPEELVIKTVGNTVHVEAKHEEKTSGGHSFSTKSFQQSFTLPRGVNPELVSSSLSKDGTLTISAPLPKAVKNESSERMVPVKFN